MQPGSFVSQAVPGTAVAARWSASVRPFRRFRPVSVALVAATLCFTSGSALPGLAQPAQTLPISINAVKMKDNHTLQVDVSATFNDPNGTDIRRQWLALRIVLNGTELNPGTCPGCGWVRPQNGPLKIANSFLLDLQQAQVPRFTQNQVFEVEADIYENANVKGVAKKRAAILLPVVLIPGIFSGNGGDGTFPALETYLKTQSAAKLAAMGLLGEGYQLRTDPTGYPTLYTLGYATSSDTFAQGAANLKGMCDGINLLTYAQTVHIAAHSKGGLVARQFLLSEGKNGGGVSLARASRVIMCQSPHTGSLAAAIGNLIPGVQLSNLYPVWDWWRATVGLHYKIPPGFSNLELVTLDVIPAPLKTLYGPITYTILYSNNYPTFWAVTQVPNFVKLVGGDGIVPVFSQRGRFTDPYNNIVMGGRVPALQGVPIQEINVPGFHSGYLETAPVMGTVFGLLFSDVQ